MKLSLALDVLASVAWASAEDLLFLQNRQGNEYSNAIAAGYSAKVVSDDERRTMTTADFASYKAIVIEPPPSLGRHGRHLGSCRLKKDHNT